MCLTCGCMKPDDRHGDQRHIVMQDLVDASKASNAEVTETWENMRKTMNQVNQGQLKSSAWSPQTQR